ncbi:MAG TPA: hypothetical protein VHS03_13980, partial [Gaiellaceae bacterium]|nr:hypothetical protein [Gaiellaceae bacterium]
ADRTYEAVRDTVLTFQALVIGRAVDELTGRPPLDRVRVQPALEGIPPDTPGESSRFAVTTGDGGTFAVAGTSDTAFPNSGAVAYDVDLVVDAPGYLHTPLTVHIPAGTAFPVDAGTVSLRRDALMLKGRVTTGVPPAGVVGTTVRIDLPAGLVGFQAPFSFPHASGLAITPRPLVPVGPALALTDDAEPGATRVPLANRTGLGAGEILRLGIGGATEYPFVAGLEGPLNPARPGIANLRAPLAFRHWVSEGPAQRVTAGAPGPAANLTQDAFAEDRVAFVDDPTQLPDGGTAHVAHADPNKEEWVVVLRAEAPTDANGDYRIRPAGRAATFTVHVGPGPHVPGDPVHIVSYGQPENTLNLRV